jgi:hypothetical protein
MFFVAQSRFFKVFAYLKSRISEEFALEERIYKYIVGDFKTDPWNASEPTGIKSAYQLRVSIYVGMTKTEVHFLQALYICKTSHGCFCAYNMEFKFAQT